MGNTSSPLRLAIRRDDIEQLREVLEDAGEGAPDLINEDFTADCLLDSCCRNVHIPVHTVMTGHKHRMLELLLKYGGDPNCTGVMGRTPIHIAAAQNNVTGAKILMQYGAELYPQDTCGEYAIHRAAQSIFAKVKASVAMLQYLVEEAGKADDIRLKDDSGNTPLHAAAKCENLAAARYLIARGADAHAQNDQGKSPIECANIHFRSELEKLLASDK